jgi:hypothetical protein
MKGPTNTDRRNNFVAAIVWKPNYFRSHRLLNAALDGWTVSPIVKLTSGAPFTVTTGVDNNNNGNSPQNANQIGEPYASSNSVPTNHSNRTTSIYRWFNPNAFCSYTLTNPSACPGTGPDGSDGTSQRNGFYGPGYRNVDLAILRDFHLYRSMVFQIRGESTNVFNLVSLNAPNGAINISGTTNQITGAAAMREIQIGGRLTF